MPTPHNKASKGQFAKTVLMPGDPLRAKFIAETFLEDAVQVTSVRNVLGYTGTYKGKPVSVMASGMGMPSIGIYSYELFKFYDVDTIIRVGSAGGYTEDLKLFDVVLASSAYSDSSFGFVQNGDPSDVKYPSDHTNERIRQAAKDLGIPLVEGRIYSSDVFYLNSDEGWKKYRDEHGAVACEMESFALFHNARVLNKNAACLVTISDSFVYDEIATTEERQTAFTKMMQIALSAAE